MASLPQRPESQRRPPQREDSASSHAPHQQRQNSHDSSSTTSAVLLNPSLSSSQSQEAAPQSSEQNNAPQATTAGPAAADNEDAEPRRCWICFNDETEDEENTSEWRSPCPCVLVAHEKCLLDWIADMEAPSSRRITGGRKDKILCPQCKSEIKLQRPRSIVVDAVRFVERAAGMLLLPGVMAFAGSATATTLSLIGRLQVQHIFGAEDALQILGPLYRFPYLGGGSLLLRWVKDIEQHWRLHIGLPLIPTVLILSRTRLADSFLPFIPLIFFVSPGGPQDDMLRVSWPPSAAFTVATLPYMRALYNAYYDRVWFPKEQQWLKEIQPRAGADADHDAAVAAHDQVHDHDHMHDDEFPQIDEDGEDVLEVEIDMDIFADWMNGGPADNNAALDNPPAPAGPPLHIHIEDDVEHPVLNGVPDGEDDMPDLEAIPDGPGPGPAQNMPQPPEPRPRANRIRQQRDVAAFSTLSLADTILGALVFPSIAAAVGECLKYALPKSWVTPPASRFLGSGSGKAGFLQTRWGRSILGGCLFVGVKDAVMLYVRWKMAQNHRRRSVLDYDKSKGKRRAGRT